MAARNTTDAKRFVFRAPHHKPESYLVPVDESQPNKTPRKTPVPPKPSSPMKQTPSPSPPLTRRSTEAVTPRTEAPPARRIVVVRSPNNPNVHRGPVDLGDFGKPNAIERRPALSNDVSETPSMKVITDTCILAYSDLSHSTAHRSI